MPSSAMKPTEAGTDRYSPATSSAEDAADQRERDVGEDQQRLAHRAEGREQQQEDQRQRDRHHDHQPRRRALLVLELAAPGQAVAGRQLDLSRRLRPWPPRRSRPGRGRATLACDDGEARRVLAVDLDRARRCARARATLAERHAAAVGHGEAQRCESRPASRAGCPAPRSTTGVRRPGSMHDADAARLRAARAGRSAMSSTSRPSRPAASRSIATCRYCTPSFCTREDVLGAAHCLRRVAAISPARRFSVGEVGAEDLDRQVAAHAGQHFRHAHLDRLREAEADAGEVGHDRAHLVDQPGLVRLAPGARAACSTMKVSVSLRPIGSRPSSSEPTRATMAFDFRHLRQNAPAARGCRWRWSASRPIDGSFSSCMMTSPSSIVGMKVLPSSRKAPAAAASAMQRRRSCTIRLWRSAEASTRSIGGGQLAHQPRFVMRAALEQVGGEHRHHGQRQQQRSRPARRRW